MKTFRFYAFILLAFLSPFTLLAKNKWNDPDKGYFKYQKDVDATVSNSSESMATIYFHGKLFNFINYLIDYDIQNKVIIRKLTLSADKKNWSMIKQDEVENLRLIGVPGPVGVHTFQFWQPAPVVFNNTLLLFLSKTDNTIGYSVYDEVNDHWSTLKQGPTGCSAEYMTAVVVADKLFIIARDKETGKASFFWTKDLLHWNRFKTGIRSFLYSDNGLFPYSDKYISAISKSWKDKNGKISSKLMVAYHKSRYLSNDPDTVKVAEFAIDDSDNITQLNDLTVSTGFSFNSSITIIDGKVKGDPATGDCTQVFIKNDTKDNLYCRYRLLRYQKEEGGSWSKRENNLVPQNYLWADKYLNINAVNFPSGDGKQLMCLIYRGYDDWDHPMNIAWAENTQPVVSSVQSKLLSNPVIGQKRSSDSKNPGENISMVRNWPNPVTTTTTIQYKVVNENPETGIEFQRYTTLSVYDNRGTLVKTLVNELKMPGTYEVQWDVSSLPAGIYICKLLNGKQSATCKLVVNK